MCIVNLPKTQNNVYNSYHYNCVVTYINEMPLILKYLIATYLQT